MKVMYLTRQLSIGGVTKCIYNLCNGLVYEEDPIVCAYPGKLENSFVKLGIHCYNIPDVGKRNPLILFKALLKIRRLIKTESINLIHSHHRMTTFLANIAVIGTKVKVIHTQHLNIEDKYVLTHFVLKKVPTICVSHAAAEILVTKSKLQKRQIQTIYNTIDFETNVGDIDQTIVQRKEAGDFLVAQVSRLVDYKGVYEFLEVAAKVTRQNSHIKFFLIGDGPERPKLVEKIAQANLSEVVFLLGPKNNILKQLEYIDLMILCSKIEGLPLSPIEAFYSGIPVIASDINGIREEIESGKNGYLIPQAQVDMFADKILYLFESTTIYKAMKKEAKQTFVDKFTKEQYVQAHQRFYEKILNELPVS